MGVLALPEISAVPFHHRYSWTKIYQSIALNNGAISDFSERRQGVREEFPLRSQEATIYATYGNMYTTLALGVRHTGRPGQPCWER